VASIPHPHEMNASIRKDYGVGAVGRGGSATSQPNVRSTWDARIAVEPGIDNRKDLTDVTVRRTRPCPKNVEDVSEVVRRVTSHKTQIKFTNRALFEFEADPGRYEYR
jgi:hypothetical protein